MSLEDETTRLKIIKFLITNEQIKKINFAFSSNDRYRVYPSAYSKDVANALISGAIKVKTQQSLQQGAVASYDQRLDRMDFGPGFDLGDYHSQGDLVHECTHAHLDIQGIGLHPCEQDEAVAYVAEAVFLEGLRKGPRSWSPYRRAA